MWTIRQEQTEAFRQYHLQRFEDEMVEHSKKFSPRLSQVIGEAQLHKVVRAAITKGNKYSFTNKGPLRLFVELTFLCGSGFDTDPQYPTLGQALRSANDQMTRAEQIHQGSLEYLEKVSGPNNINVRNALQELAVFAQKAVDFPRKEFTGRLIQEMTRIFPQKVAYVRDLGLTKLIDEGIAEAQRFEFWDVRELTLIIVLMFSFGHGCTEDPLYPWISNTLRDPRIVSPGARARRLEKKALVWLSHVLARPTEERT